ncbi:hypothetical protein PPL_03901 [Heterostelium album PN500]|uniref:Uncharacterized protein n=1 Tax=Heterostelium pallidum (strain ATCC 26659 / Pp 5 / PN500) TaxID=670386 RepID=D3B5G3_HETP5|nr:hypothetical protein PPL_03901 [Heterostelium album PN500]EFA83111.1 hypothetical protein PPL_03901 [Heterostelium album PN500]|eukprot:XP_020435228.1 hypothetical protein PPL_03901 [Heterostelium album PN500]
MSQLSSSTDNVGLSKSQEFPLSISTMLGVSTTNATANQQQQQHAYTNSLSSVSEENDNNNMNNYYCLMIKEYSSSPADNNNNNNDNNNNNQNQSFTLNIVHTNATNIQTHNIKSFILSKLLKNLIFKRGSIGRIEDTSLASSSNSLNTNVIDSLLGGSLPSSSSNNKNNEISCYYTLIEVQEPTNTSTTTTTTTSINNNLTTSSSSSSNTTTKTTTTTTTTTSDLTGTNSTSDDTLDNTNSPLVQTDIENLDFSININDNQILLSEIENCGNIIKEYYLCLCYEHPESQVNNIDTFHLELGDFCYDIGYLIKSSNQEILTNTLSNWYSLCINYLTRTIDMFNDKISLLLHSSLSGYAYNIETPNDLIAKDIIHFLRSISIPNLTVIKTSSESDSTLFKYELNPESVNSIDTIVNITVTKENTLILNYKGTNGFCRKWCRIFLDAKADSLRLRNLAEEFKLKVIQELNHFRRMVDSSKNNNYLLYKSFLFLVGSDNSDILFDLLKKDNDDPAVKEILNILQLQLQQQLQQ